MIMYQLGWFSTGRDKAARDLLQAVQSQISLGEIKAEIAFVFCSRELGESETSDLFLRQADDYHLPLICFSYQKFKDRQDSGSLPQRRLEYDREVMKRLRGFNPDLCVLAGYMLIVGPEMCRRYDMINLHPAAPGGPSGTWQEVIWQLIDSQAEQTGVMIHLVTSELDKGPPVTYATFPIRSQPFCKYWDEIKGYSLEKIKRQQGERNRLFQLIRQHGLAREFPLLIVTIKAFSEGKISINSEKQVIDSSGRPIKGYNLSQEIHQQVKDFL